MQNLDRIYFTGSATPVPRRAFRRDCAGVPLRLVPRAAETQPSGFLAWVLARGGIDPGRYRSRALERRLPACLRALQVTTPEAGQRLLEYRPELLSKALNALLIGVTDFFRDSAVFQVLRDQVLPELLSFRGFARVLSAGCADGRELYSVGMLLADLGALGGSVLQGVDCRADGITQARRGMYSLEQVRAVPPALRAGFFDFEGSIATVKPEVRARFSWRLADLANWRGWEEWDLILFRNVAIYLNQDETGVWHTIHHRLAPGGVLVTGKAEQPLAELRFRKLACCIYQKGEPR